MIFTSIGSGLLCVIVFCGIGDVGSQPQPISKTAVIIPKNTIALLILYLSF
jgi:hypothetical protein